MNKNIRAFLLGASQTATPIGTKRKEKDLHITSLPSPDKYKGNIKKLPSDLNIVHCEKLELESGKIIYRYWGDKTFRNFLERMAFGGDIK